MSTTTTGWTYLSPNPKSSYKQLFIKGTRIRARVLYGWYACEEPRTPEEIAADCLLLSKAGLPARRDPQSRPRVRRKKQNRRTPLGSLGTAHDVVAVAEFLTSDSARFITGEFIAVDGGITC